MGGSKSKTTTNQTQNTTERASTTPTWSLPVTGDIQNYLDAVSDLGSRDPQSFVAGPSQGQQMAFGNLNRLGDWRSQSAAASGALANIANQGAFTARANLDRNPTDTFTGSAPMSPGTKTGFAGVMQGWNPPGAQTPANNNGVSRVGDSAFAQASLFQAPQAGQAQQATTQTYNPVNISPASLVSGQGYEAAQAQSASGIDNLSAYMNPYMRDVVDATAADITEAENRARGIQLGRAAGAKAFGDRGALAETQLEGELARARASTLGGLRAQGFNTAAGLSQNDAALRTQTNLANMDGLNTARGFSAAAENAARSQNAESLNRFSLFDADAANRSREFAANAGNTTSMFNTQQGNAWSLADLDRQADAARTNAGMQTQVNLTNAGSANDMARFNASQQDNAANRGVQAASMLGQLANQYGDGTRADLGTMAAIGDQQRQIEQQQRLAEIAQLQAMNEAYNPILSLIRGQNVEGTTNGTMSGTSTQRNNPGLFNQMLALGSLATSFIKPSDRRLKRDVSLIGRMANGLGIYRYRYLWTDTEQTGVMADEVARILPEALGPTIGGFATVDYSKLGVA